MLDHDFDDRDVVFLVSPPLSQRPCPEVLPSIRLWLGARALPMKGEHQAASFVDSLASLAIASESGRSPSQ